MISENTNNGLKELSEIDEDSKFDEKDDVFINI